VNTSVAPLRSDRGPSTRRRALAVDGAIVLSSTAALAHFVAAPGHYTWWPAAGVFFAALGVAQLAYAVILLRGALGNRLLLVGIWGTVGVIMVYVASRTVGIPMAPPVSAHGGRWIIGRSAVPDGAKYVGPLDIMTLVAEIVLVVALLGQLPTRLKNRAVNRLMWIGLVVWGAAAVSFVW
jgi:hypothetical protein